MGIGHVAMIGLLVNKSNFPAVNLPVGDYTSYHVERDKDGYSIQYNANDPKVMSQTRSIDKPAGFLGLRRPQLTPTKNTPWMAKHLGGHESGKAQCQTSRVYQERKVVDSQQVPWSAVVLVLVLLLSCLAFPLLVELATGWSYYDGSEHRWRYWWTNGY